MSQSDFDVTVRKRLQREIYRRDLSLDDLSSKTGLAGLLIEETLCGTQDLSLEYLDLICEALHLNLFWLMSDDYMPSRTLFRDLKGKSGALEIASEVENAFLCILEFLPNPICPKIPEPRTEDNSREMLIAEVLQCVDHFRRHHGSDPGDIFDTLKLPVFSRGSDEFNAFLMAVGKHYALCLSEYAPDYRIRFSLFHELAHFLFHGDQDFLVELIQPQFYGDRIPEKDIPEFIANKFAQYLMLPFESIEQLWVDASWKWEQLEVPEMQALLDSTGASIEVLAHSLHDISLMKVGRSSYKAFSQYLDAVLRPPQNSGNWFREFMFSQRERIDTLLRRHEDEFSSRVLGELRYVLQIPEYVRVVNE